LFVSSQIRGKVILGIFSKLHFFPGGKGSVENAENLRDFFKVALFFPAGKDPWRRGGKLRDFFKVALFFPAGKDPLRFGGRVFPRVLYVPAKSPRM
jgi:hypothetical protein